MRTMTVEPGYLSATEVELPSGPRLLLTERDMADQVDATIDLARRYDIDRIAVDSIGVGRAFYEVLVHRAGAEFIVDETNVVAEPVTVTTTVERYRMSTPDPQGEGTLQLTLQRADGHDDRWVIGSSEMWLPSVTVDGQETAVEIATMILQRYARVRRIVHRQRNVESEFLEHLDATLARLPGVV